MSPNTVWLVLKSWRHKWPSPCQGDLHHKSKLNHHRKLSLGPRSHKCDSPCWDRTRSTSRLSTPCRSWSSPPKPPYIWGPCKDFKFLPFFGQGWPLKDGVAVLDTVVFHEAKSRVPLSFPQTGFPVWIPSYVQNPYGRTAHQLQLVACCHVENEGFIIAV